MMRKDQLRTSTMHIVRRPKVRQGNRSIFDVPARPSSSPRTVPEYLSRLLALPQCEVPWMLLSRVRVHPVNRQVLLLLVRELSITRKPGNVKVDITINPVCQSFLEKSCDLVDDLGNMIRSIRVQVYAVDVQVLHVPEE